jgi:hypothetical protein
LKRLSQKSLPASSFSRGGELLGDLRKKIPLFPPLERGKKGVSPFFKRIK